MAAMAQQPPPVADEADRIGEVVLGRRLRGDRLGEVWRGVGPRGEAVRVRITVPVADPLSVVAVVDRVAALGSATVAPVVDRLVDGRGRVAVVTPAGVTTLASRRRRGPLSPAALAALGPALLDGLADLHAAGIAHGAVGPDAVEVDAEGTPQWHDAGLAAALGTGPGGAAGLALDLAECAALLRDLGPLPTDVAVLVEPVAAGAAEAVWNPVALAAAWRRAASGAGFAVGPRGERPRIPDLLPPPPRPRRRLSLPPRIRAGLALVCAIGAAALPAAAWATGAARAPFAPLDAYLPRSAHRLTYRLGPAGTSTVTLDVVQTGVIAGVLTVTTRPEGNPGPLPLGLDGATTRLDGGALRRTAAGGSVRDLQEPLAPGASWSDRRTVVAGTAVVETRTVVGPVDLTVAAGHFTGCVAVRLRSAATSVAGPGETATGITVLCPAVGLVRAQLHGRGGSLDVELVAVR